MEEDLIKLDKKFTDQYYGLYSIHDEIYKKLKSYKFDLEKDEINQAVLNRMWAFWHFVNENNKLLDKKVNTIAADFFTETCLFFLKAYFEGKGFKVKSEVNIQIKGHKAIRPDVSIWKENSLVAVIELKVSNGYKGGNMMNHLKEREEIIKNIHPNTAFGVIAFWNFFNPNELGSDWATKYVGLMNFHKTNATGTGAWIEHLIKHLEKSFVLN